SAGRLWGIDVTASAGVRYAYLEQTYNVFHPGVTTTTITNLAVGIGPPLQITSTNFQSDTLISRQTFTGAGPSLGMDMTRGLGDGRLALFASSRGAVLFGEGHQELENRQFVRSQSTAAAPVLSNPTRARTDSGGWDVLPVLEMQVGAQLN